MVCRAPRSLTPSRATPSATLALLANITSLHTLASPMLTGLGMIKKHDNNRTATMAAHRLN
jgi:hypothetical protein